MNKNPFAEQTSDDDKTSFFQSSGGGNQTQSQPFSGESALSNIAQITNYSNNPLVNAAVSLLSLVPQLQTTASYTKDVSELRNKIIKEIKRFEVTVQRQVDAEQSQAAHYALCTMLDETILNTPWGHHSIWANNGLLIAFHREAFGGEKFFIILNSCLQKPEKYLNLLEFLYFCLCLGFQGRYRIDKDYGMGKLEEIREKTYQVIQRQRGDMERDLSLHWQGIKSKRNELTKLIPLWVIGTGVMVALLVVFSVFFMLIDSDAVSAQIDLARKDITAPLIITETKTYQPPVIVPTPPALKTQIKTFLEPEVQQHQVELIEQPDGKMMIRIISNGLFESGSDEIMPQYYPLLSRISQALVEFKIEHISVIGHTDNSPIGYSLRFRSNTILSKARAETVAKILKENTQLQSTMTIEGHGEREPIPGVVNKAMNRRVEIIL